MERRGFKEVCPFIKYSVNDDSNIAVLDKPFWDKFNARIKQLEAKINNCTLTLREVSIYFQQFKDARSIKSELGLLKTYLVMIQHREPSRIDTEDSALPLINYLQWVLIQENIDSIISASQYVYYEVYFSHRIEYLA
jgi:hypothetical protein